uniref:ribonuclease H n=1 Tax=Oryzias latipes TaxID=8090 RepID=A0A3P9JF00_ORYLA
MDGRESRLNVLEELNEALITGEEVEQAVGKLKVGKAAGVDGCAVECLKSGGAIVIEWLVRLLNVCFANGQVPLDWMSACVVPLYKGKGDKYECGSFRGISLLSVVGKVYGRVLINRVVEGTEGMIGEEQCGFRRGRGCVDQVFVVRQVCEKFLAKGREVFWAFMDLEKAYDRIDREALWVVLSMYGIDGSLLEGVKSFYRNSRACVRVGNSMSEWFPVRVGLRQGCVMSPWLFNVYMDGVVKEVNERVSGTGVSMVNNDGSEWSVNQLLFADDTALVADSEESLARLVEEFGRVCDRRKLRVNVEKSKVMRCTRVKGERRLNVALNG